MPGRTDARLAVAAVCTVTAFSLGVAPARGTVFRAAPGPGSPGLRLRGAWYLRLHAWPFRVYQRCGAVRS